VTPLVAQLLLNRGITGAAEARRFLNPELSALLSPDSLPGAVEAARRLLAAVRQGRKIVIYGDYDVDGVTGTAILWHGLKLSGAQVDYYVPSRLDEGYGLNRAAIEQLASAGAGLLITVDCGITAVDEARRARDLGMELIITDHHMPHRQLPEATVIVHPTAVRVSPNPDLSGAGVALKVMWALAQELSGRVRVSAQFRELLVESLAFAALGLIADVVPLTGENRVIASFGLRQLKSARNPGLRALLEVARLTNKKCGYDDYDVGFMLAPRLNAIGRMDHARQAVELFTSADAARAAKIAAALDAENRRRQQVERQIVKQAEALVRERGYHRDGCRAIVLASHEWHAGVIGIAAARLVERFQRPTVLISLEGGYGQGSGRSVRHFPLHEVLERCAGQLESFGGHAMAAGLRLREDQVAAFTAAFQAEAARRLTTADLRPKLHLDDEVDLSELTEEVVDMIHRLAPFGTGNPRPRLASKVVELVDQPRVVGPSGGHVQFTVRQGSTYRRAVAFNRGAQAEQLAEHRRLRLAFEPLLNEWNGQRRVELKVLDWKASA